MPEKKMRRTDPRIRQTLNQISHNLESANIATQASLFSFSEAYLSPCLTSFHTCLEASCHPCFTARDDQRQPHRNARRGRDEPAFEFYDDWNEEAGEWGNDELDRLLARSDHQPGRHGSMNYGSRIIRRKSLAIPKDGTADPTVVPSSSIFGFLERLPWKIGRRGRRYRPSAADLHENVGRARSEGDRLLDERDGSGSGSGSGGAAPDRGRPGRNRSATAGSQTTTNSLSSRGDLFPSEDEADAVPIDDEFAMLLARRNTGTTLDDRSSGPNRPQRPAASQKSTNTVSSLKIGDSLGKSASTGSVPGLAPDGDEGPSLHELKQEEEHVRHEEEARIEKNRQAAQRLARQRGLSNPPIETSAVSLLSSFGKPSSPGSHSNLYSSYSRHSSFKNPSPFFPNPPRRGGSTNPSHHPLVPLLRLTLSHPQANRRISGLPNALKTWATRQTLGQAIPRTDFIVVIVIMTTFSSFRHGIILML